MIKQKIIKAEILLSRRCNLSCIYCGIQRRDRRVIGIDLWKKILDNLKELGCSITPIYGAEPTLEFDLLKSFIEYAEGIGISTTLITNATMLESNKLEELYKVGLRSLTVSIDTLRVDCGDTDRRRRDSALVALKKFKEFGEIRDREISVTISKKNLLELPLLIEEFNKEGIWVSFDALHWNDRGRDGSSMPDDKCIPLDRVRDIVLKPVDTGLVFHIMSLVEYMKIKGYRIHQSLDIIDMWKDGFWRGLDWSCGGRDMGFVTIDCDGSMMVCDSFGPEKMHELFKGWDLVEKWDSFEAFREQLVKGYGCCCFWSTHIMSQKMVGKEEGIKNFLHV